MNPDLATTLARYNQWMNDRLYATCDGVSDAARKEDRGLFFRSIHGTLNHILLADKIWLGRFTGDPFQVSGLDQELFADFEDLRAARTDTDRFIVDWASGLTEAELGGELHYRSVSKPGDKSCAMSTAVMHLFNHQTHHRGQVTAALAQLGVDYGVTDLIYMPGAE